MHNAITQSRKVNIHYQHSQGMAQQSTGNVKSTLPYPRNVAQERCRKDKGYKEKWNLNTCSREEAKRERGRKI